MASPDYRFSRPLDAPKIRALSLGGGVQSCTLAFMSARGDLEPLDFAIFSDTGHEPRLVYEYLDWMEPQLPFPIVRVRRDGFTLADHTIAIAKGEIPRGPMPPLYTSEPKGMLPKQCSKEFKVRPVERHIRDLLGLEPRQRGPKEVLVELWIGISRDEIERLGRSEKKYIHHRHPLIEQGMTRAACLRWMEERQLRFPVKSSCIFCPFRDQPAWRRMKLEQPDDFALACEIDDAMRPGWPGMTGQAFVHRQMVPLRDADLNESQLDFEFECEGHCNT